MKAEDLINKHLTLEGGSDLAITDGRIYNAFLNALNEAINYTRCCKSDSEQLCANCLCKPTQKLGFCNECFDNIYSNA
tara:strand:+ start:423 stop:656 length:234 start_codon:yes stop_codon:yes gene_type:complete